MKRNIHPYPQLQRLFLVLLTIFALSFAEAQVIKRHVSNHVSTYKSKDGMSSFEIKSKGDIEVTNDDRGIKSISPGGFLRFKKTTFGNTRGIEVNSNSNGRLSYAYYEGKKERPFEPEGKKWMADVLIEVIRRSGISAESRVKRIYAKSGTDGVLAEINMIESSGTMGIYFKYLLRTNNLSPKDLQAIAPAISRISSSGEQGSIFREFGSKFLAKDETAHPYYAAISRISSSGEQGSILRKNLKEETLSESMLIDLLQTCRNISSSGEQGSILRSFKKRDLTSARVVGEYFQTVKLISSSGEQGSVLRYATEQSFARNDQVFEAFFDALESISSSGEQGAVLRKLLDDSDLDVTTSIRVFKAVTRISSSSEQGSVLRKAVPLIKGQEQAFKAFLEASKTISSSSELGGVYRAVVSQGNLSKTMMIDLLEATHTISSPSEQGSVLRGIGRIMPKNDPEVRKAFMNAAKHISSDSEYRSVMEYVN